MAKCLDVVVLLFPILFVLSLPFVQYTEGSPSAIKRSKLLMVVSSGTCPSLILFQLSLGFSEREKLSVIDSRQLKFIVV